MLDAGADLNARTKLGATPLHLAAAFNQKPTVLTALLNAGADLNTRDKDGFTPLHVAAEHTQNPAIIAPCWTPGPT